MKKILIILDGLADKGNNTSLHLAKTPNLDLLAKNGKTGLMYPIKNIAPESSASQFSILGQDLAKCPGRGPIEALGLGIKLKRGEIALRCNFANIKHEKITNPRANIPPKKVISKLNKINSDIKIIPSVGYRAVMIVKNASPNISNTHPGYIKYKNISKAITPTNTKKICKGDKKTSDKINSFIEKAEKILKNRTILIRGAGKSPSVTDKMSDWALIADMPVEIGLGKLLGMQILKKGKDKIKQIIRCKKNVYVQIKGPDTYGHKGDKKAKIKAIEQIDKTLKPLTQLKNIIICITSDHATPCSLKRHSKDPVPLLIYGKGKDNVKKFSEKDCKKGSLGIIQGKDLMKLL